MDHWKVITVASLSLLVYQVYQDYNKHKNQAKPRKKYFKICLTGGP
jgi:uncharacterized membrane protein YebE (DUF533 family)